MLFYKKNNKVEEKENELKAYISGKVISITEVADSVFASKVLGDGIAILPDGNTVFAPCGGTISMLADTGHAVGITADNGAEILIHIGLDTVSLNGEGFKIMTKQEKRVKLGDPLIKFDKGFIEKKGLASDCILVVTNADAFTKLEFQSGIMADQGETVIGTF